MGLLDYVVVEVQIGIDLVGGRQFHVLTVGTIEDSDGEGGRKDAVVEVETRPRRGLVESLEVLGAVEKLKENLHLLAVFLVIRRVDGITTKHAVFVQVQEFLDDQLREKWKVRLMNNDVCRNSENEKQDMLKDVIEIEILQPFGHLSYSRK